MNQRIIFLINKFVEQSHNKSMSSTNKVACCLLDYYIKQIGSQQIGINLEIEIEKIIFGLLYTISDDKTFDYQLILYFSDIIIAIIDDKIKNDQDIHALITAFDKMKVELDIPDKIKNMKTSYDLNEIN